MFNTQDQSHKGPDAQGLLQKTKQTTRAEQISNFL